MATKSAIEHRHNRVAKGFTKQEEHRRAKGRGRAQNPVNMTEKEKMLLTLEVKGTTDVLKGYRFYCKTITVKHPTDYGFSRQAYVLNDMGKAKLKRLKRAKQFAADCV